MITRKRYLTNGAIIVIVFTSIIFYAHANGVTGKTQKNGSGCTCHALNPSTAVSVAIWGPDQLSPGATGNYILSVKGGPLSAAGTNIASSTGTLTPLNGLKLSGTELTHTAPKNPTGDSVVFNFTYQAPQEAGTITLYAAANSVNLNGSNSGDAWNFAPQKQVTVTAATGVDDDILAYEFRLNQNYPNPFNPTTKISFTVPPDASGSRVILKVYDMLGEETAELVNEIRPAGKYEVSFDASNFNSGVYVYKLTAGNYSNTRKMILLK